MFCSFCGKEIRDGATFCSKCGKNQLTGEMKPGATPLKSGTVVLVATLVCFIIVIACISRFRSNSIVGVWMHGADKVTFTSDGDFQIDSTYGTYTIDDSNTLIMSCGEYSYLSGTLEYEYGPEAKEDEDYWYISNGKLYFWGDEYTKK